MDKPEAIKKIRNLLRLAGDSNSPESTTAQALAAKLQEKYEINEEEIAIDDSPLYGEDEKLYESELPISWKSRLAFLVANKNYCYIVQEQQKEATGVVRFCYFVFGDAEDVANTKLLFSTALEKIEALQTALPINKDQNYIVSYLEGAVEGFKVVLEEEIVLPKAKVKPRKIKNDSLAAKEVPSNLVKNFPKEKPVEATQKIEVGMILDPYAYWAGLLDGERIKIVFNLLEV